MGYTLDQLLDTTGVSDLAGTRAHKKTASAGHDFSKLAERCRRAAEATPDEQSASDQQELVEKTASVAIINRTLGELREIDGEPAAHEKVAGSSFDLATFIKTALDAGHSPEHIAEFIDKEAGPGGLLSRIGGRISEMRAARSVRKGEGQIAKAQAAGRAGKQRYEDVLRKGELLDERKRDAIVSRLRIAHGDDVASKLVAGNKSYKDLPSAKGLKGPEIEAGPAAAAPAKALGVNIGGNQYGISSDTARKLKKPLLYGGAGYLGHKALTAGKSDDSSSGKKGVVVVNS